MQKISDNAIKQNSNGDWAWSRSGSPCTAYEKDLKTPRKICQPLDKDVECDVAVIGGGYVGLSAAITLAEAGKHVVILEKDCIGDAASGRNGGHLTPGLGRWSVNELVEEFGEEMGGQVWRNVSQHSMNFTDELIERYNIQAERVFGHLTLAFHPEQVGELESYLASMAKHGYDKLQSIGRESVADHVKSSLYHGAMLDMLGGHVNPLAYVQGLASAAESIKNAVDSKDLVHIYENTTAIEIDNADKKVRTENGTVTAREAIVLAAHANTIDLSGKCGSKTINLTSYQLATNPLSNDMIKNVLPSGYAALDTQVVLFYYRITESRRLVFGALGEATPLSPSKAMSVLSKGLFTLFPQLKDNCTFDHMWNGTLDVTVNGAVNVSNDQNLYIVNGWSGHGVAQSTWFGSSVARAILGDGEDFRLLSTIKHRSIPMAQSLAPYLFPAFMLHLKIKNKIWPEKISKF